MKTVNHKRLIELGFSKASAKQIIREAKAIAIRRFNEASNSSDNVLKLSKSPFDNRRLDLRLQLMVNDNALKAIVISGVNHLRRRNKPMMNFVEQE